MAAVIDYTNTIPSDNNFPGDKNYLASIISSLDELMGLNKSIIDDKRFRSVSKLNKGVFYRNQSSLFVLKKLGFTTTGKSSKPGPDRYRTLGDYYQLHNNTILIDTTDFDEADYVYKSNNVVINYFADSVKNYPEAIKYTKISIELIKGFHKKYPQNAVYLSDLSSLYGNMGWYLLFTRDFKNSYKYSEDALGMMKKDFIYSNLAMAYLLNKDYDKAWTIYRDYKNKIYENDPRKRFKDIFLQDFETMEANKILTSKQPDIYAKANEIIKFLKE
jgi:tetratricopeptide (TPR) repeat protein